MKNLITIILLFSNLVTNAQLDIWNKINKSSSEKENFALVIKLQDVISKNYVLSVGDGVPSDDKVLTFLQPSINMDATLRFGKKSKPDYWYGVNFETKFSAPIISARFCGLVGYKDILSFVVYFDAISLRTNHRTEYRALSKNYEKYNLMGVRGELCLGKIYAKLDFEKNRKIDFIDFSITYNCIPDKLNAGFETKSILGSGPIVAYSFGKRAKQISVAWLVPQNSEKDKFQTQNKLYISGVFPIY